MHHLRVLPANCPHKTDHQANTSIECRQTRDARLTVWSTATSVGQTRSIVPSPAKRGGLSIDQTNGSTRSVGCLPIQLWPRMMSSLGSRQKPCPTNAGVRASNAGVKRGSQIPFAMSVRSLVPARKQCTIFGCCPQTVHEMVVVTTRQTVVSAPHRQTRDACLTPAHHVWSTAVKCGRLCRQ